MKALAEIKEALEAGTMYRPIPHRAVVNTAGDRHGVVDSSGSVVTMDSPPAAKFYAAAPTHLVMLITAVEAVLALHVMEYIEDGDDSRTRCADCLYEQDADEPCPTVATLYSLLGGGA